MAAALETVLVAGSVDLIYPAVNEEMFAKAIFANMTLFPILIGIPVSALLQDEFGFVPHDRRLKAEEVECCHCCQYPVSNFQ